MTEWLHTDHGWTTLRGRLSARVHRRQANTWDVEVRIRPNGADAFSGILTDLAANAEEGKGCAEAIMAALEELL